MSHRRAKHEHGQQRAAHEVPAPRSKRVRDRDEPVKAPARRGAAQGARRQRWTAVGSVVALALIVGGVVIARGNSGSAPAVRVSSSGGPVQLRGTDPVTGTSVDIASYAGKPVVINIWASWCPGCRDEAPDLRRFAEAHPEAQLIGIDIQDNPKDAKAFNDEFGWFWPSVDDPDGSISASLGLQGLPTTLFLDRQHRVVSRIVGASNFEGFERGLRDALGEPA